jgi:hypothetical protein
MSSYSEYLGRMKQRMQTVKDTRPHRDAGHQTEIVKRIAASGVLDSKTPKSAGVMVLNGPSTRINSYYGKAHSVQDAAIYADYVSGQAVAQSEMRVNAKTPQINVTCYSSTAIPEYNDKLRTDSSLAAIQAAKTAYQLGYITNAACEVRGEPPVFAGSCTGKLTVAQQNALKDKVGTRIHTSQPNA